MITLCSYTCEDILQLEVKGWSRASGDTCLKLQKLVMCDMQHPALRLLLLFSGNCFVYYKFIVYYMFIFYYMRC